MRLFLKMLAVWLAVEALNAFLVANKYVGSVHSMILGLLGVDDVWVARATRREVLVCRKTWWGGIRKRWVVTG